MAQGFAELVPELREGARALVDVAARAGAQPRVTSTRRTRAQQARLYRRYLAGASRFPALPPGQSAHEYGLAFDILITPEEWLADLGSVWTSWGGAWGGESDPVHFELPGASAWAKAQAPAPVRREPGLLGSAFDIVVGFLIPAVGAAQLVAWLLSFGYPHSTALYLVQNPSQIPQEILNWMLEQVLGTIRR